MSTVTGKQLLAKYRAEASSDNMEFVRQSILDLSSRDQVELLMLMLMKLGDVVVDHLSDEVLAETRAGIKAKSEH